MTSMETAALSSRLDSEIATLKSQITQLRAKKAALTSTLLASPRVTKYAAGRPEDTYTNPLNDSIAIAQREQSQKFFRAVVGVTSFPFTDPSTDEVCIGVRFDLSDRYFVILRKDPLRVQTSTVPRHIDVEGHSVVLPDLHEFVERVHGDLRAWEYRKRGVALVKSVEGRFGVRSLESTNDAREVRIGWVRADGIVKVGYDGAIVGLAVFGKRDGISKGHEGMRLVEWERYLYRSKWDTQRKLVDAMTESIEDLWRSGLVEQE